MLVGRQADKAGRLVGRQAGGQVGWWVGRLVGRQAGGQVASGQAGWWAGRLIRQEG